MALDEPRRVVVEVDVRGNDSADLASHGMHRDARTALEAASSITAAPGVA